MLPTKNVRRITIVSFLAYFVMSGMLAPIGIVSGPMAELFDTSIIDATERFSWLTMGIFCGAIAALFLFDWIPLKKLLTVIYSAICLSLLSLYLLDDLALIGPALGIVGLGCGLGLAGAALVISRTYDADRRASMLIITDSFFSVAGFVCAAIATWMIAREFHWAGVYQFVALIALVIVLLTLTSTFPATKMKKRTDSPPEYWPPSVWLCIAALFLYTLGQYSMLWWLPNYTVSALGASREAAGSLVSLFWIGVFSAQIFVAWSVMKIGVRRIVMIAGVTTSLFSVPLWLYGNVSGLSIFAFLWGFANLSLLIVVLSFATQMVALPTPRLVSSLLLGATTGTAVSPWVTRRIVAATDHYVILQFSTACYVTLTILLVTATRLFSDKDRIANR